MTEFFTEPPVELYFARKAATEAAIRMEENLVLQPEIARLQEASQYLAGVLLSRTTSLVEPNYAKNVELGEQVSVIDIDLVPNSKRGFMGSKAPKGQIVSETPGWIVSKSKTTAQARAVALLENGALVLTHDPVAKTRQAVRIGNFDFKPHLSTTELERLYELREDLQNPHFLTHLSDDEKAKELAKYADEKNELAVLEERMKSNDITFFRPHPQLATPRGYTETYGSIPKMVSDDSLVRGSRAANVAANLEHIGRDMRTVYSIHQSSSS